MTRTRNEEDAYTGTSLRFTLVRLVHPAVARQVPLKHPIRRVYPTRRSTASDASEQPLFNASRRPQVGMQNASSPHSDGGVTPALVAVHLVIQRYVVPYSKRYVGEVSTDFHEVELQAILPFGSSRPLEPRISAHGQL